MTTSSQKLIINTSKATTLTSGDYSTVQFTAPKPTLSSIGSSMLD